MCLYNFFLLLDQIEIWGFIFFSMDMSRFLRHRKENFSRIKIKLILFLSLFYFFNI